MLKVGLFVGFVATVFFANWAIEQWGIVPVGFGLEAPAGVYVVGAAFTMRDALHEVAGRVWVVAAIALGALASAVVSPTFAVASAVAFLVSEYADLAVYAPLRERQLVIAVVLSGAVGACIDSAVFLWLAFGSLEFWPGQVVAKFYMVVLFLPVVWLVRRRLVTP